MGIFDNFGMKGPVENPGFLGRLGNAAHQLHNNPAWQQVQAWERGQNPFQNQQMQAQTQLLKAEQQKLIDQQRFRKIYQKMVSEGKKPDAMMAFRAGISPQEYKMLDPSAGVANPSAVREFEYFQSLDDDRKKEFLAVKRAQQIKDFGGYHGAVSPDGSVENIGNKTLKPEQELNYVTNAAAAQKEGAARGEASAAAEADLAKADQFIDLLDMAINHPGREAATGLSSLFNVAAIPGSERKDFLVLGQQLRGKNFLEAYQSLKGGGQITEIEGLKAEQAQSRLNEAQSEGEYLKALNEMKLLIAERKDLIRSKVGIAGDGWSIVED